MQIDWSSFYFLPVCIESFVFVPVVFIVVVIVFLRSRRNKRENPTMPEEGNGEKKLSFFFHLMKFMNAHASS